jgi:hypothetical protein
MKELIVTGKLLSPARSSFKALPARGSDKQIKEDNLL